MKKIFLIFPALVLLASACDASRPEARQAEVIEKKTAAPEVAGASTIPKAAEKEYEKVLAYVKNRCGEVRLLYVYNPVAVSNNKPVNQYYFTAGKCGKAGQEVAMGYDRTDNKITGNTKAGSAGKGQVIDLERWRISYLEAVIAAKQDGGSEFLEQHKGSYVASALLANEQGTGFRWVVTFKQPAEAKAAGLEIYIDPTTGSYLGKK